MLLVALSCLQGRPQTEAFDALARLPVDGIQLTPGNLPSPGFRQHVARYRGVVRHHHAFSFEHYRAQVYDAEGRTPALPRDWSLHPPPVTHAVSFSSWLTGALRVDALCEVMYPGFMLGDDAQVSAALDAGLRLAIDVSHLHIQQERGDLRTATLTRLLDYRRVEELHVSHNAGQRDSHLPIQVDTHLLGWARERAGDGLPMIFESRMHGHDGRWSDQLEMLR